MKQSDRGNSECLDVDEMLAHVGNFDKFQFILIALFSFINALSAFHYFGQTFISVEPDHQCNDHPPMMPNTSLTFSQCFVRNVNVFNGSVLERPCEHWQYNSSYGFVSIVQELNWVCTDDWIPALGQSVFFVGSLIGSLVFGILADRIGRLHVLVMSNICAFVGNFITIFAHDAISYGIARFVAGIATDANFVMMYMLVMEYIKPSMRTAGLNLSIGIFYCVASMLVPWVAVLLHHWKLFLLAVSLPHLLVLLFYFVVPESAQWLISKSRFDEAMQCFQHIARTNKRTISEKYVSGLKWYMKEHIRATRTHASFLSLLKTPKLRKKTLILIFKSMIMYLCYDAIARNVNGLGYSAFLIFSATSATIFPGCVIILLLQDRIGRKALASASLFIAGAFISIVGIILVLMPEADANIALILSMIARLNVIVAFNSGHQYAFELIPTEVRAQGISVIHVAGFGATFFSPQLLYLNGYWKPLPEICLGVLLVLGAIACLFLPETLDRTLPVTLSDGEQFGEDESIFDFACCARNLSESQHVLAK